MSTGGFSMIPPQSASTPDDDLAAAVAGAVAVPTSVRPVSPPTPLPIGTSWEFDFELGQFVHSGMAPQTAAGLFGALEQWCLMAIHSARYASVVFSDDFGMEMPDAPIGRLPSAETLADWRQNLTEALLVHDRVTSVENIDLAWDPSGSVLVVNSLTVVTDEAATVTIQGLNVPTGGMA